MLCNGLKINQRLIPDTVGNELKKISIKTNLTAVIYRCIINYPGIHSQTIIDQNAEKSVANVDVWKVYV